MSVCPATAGDFGCLAGHTRRVLAIRLLALIALLTVSACSSTDGRDSTRSGLSPQASAATIAAPNPHGDLAARWWQWSEVPPPSENPVDDFNGRFCARHQPSDVWFLAGTHGGSAVRTCALPSTQPIFFPVINQVCTVGSGENVESAIRGCTAAVDVARASLDGAPLSVRELTSVGSFQLTTVPGSHSGFAPGQHEAVAWGLWVGPTQLTPGRHTLKLLGEAGSFSTDVTYRLRVI